MRQALPMRVRGTEAQTFHFDLAATFPGFWDGRTFRALRIDTTNGQTGILAEVDYVRLLPDAPSVTVGPMFTREAVAAREAIRGIEVLVPEILKAGERGTAPVKAADKVGGARVPWSFVTQETGRAIIESEAASVPLPVLTRAGDWPWTLGLADDLGQPMRAKTGTLHLFDLARPYGIRFNVALFEDYDKAPYVSPTILEQIVLPQYTAEMLKGLPPHRARSPVRQETLARAAVCYSDPDAIACQQDYLRK